MFNIVSAFRRVAGYQFATGKSTSWVGEERTAKPPTTSCAMTPPLASSQAWPPCRGPSPTTVVLPYTVSVRSNTNPDSSKKHHASWMCKFILASKHIHICAENHTIL